MKTRDELAEAFAMALMADAHAFNGVEDHPGPELLAGAAFNFADAFVAERERRAAKVNDAPAETPAPAGLKFTASGALLSADGHRYAERERDGYSADAAKLGSGFISVVRIAARDRDHAERIVAAMLPVGRGTP